MTDPRELANRIQRAMYLVENSPYIPKAIVPSVPQWAFIASGELEVFYGGQVGGGKSISLLASALMYAHVPGYSALIIRKNFPDLSQPGGLMQVANEWLGSTDAHKKDGGKTWEFPSGASLRFGHIESPQDWTTYQGGEYQFVGFDELPQLEFSIWENLKSRLRRSTSMHPELADIPDRIRGTGNPGGKHALWVKEYFISNSDGVRVSVPNRLFLPSKTSDNPSIDLERYDLILSGLDPLRRAQMRSGDWDILPQGVMFTEEAFQIVDGRFEAPAHRVRVWDLAGSGSKTSDYCAGALLARDKDSGNYRIEHMVHEKLTPGQLDRVIQQTASLDGTAVPILIEEERSGSGKLVLAHFRRLLKGHRVVPAKPIGDKEERAGLFSSIVDHGLMELTRAKWNAKFIQECVSFPEAKHDDMVDAVSHGCHYLARLPVRNQTKGLNDSADLDADEMPTARGNANGSGGVSRRDVEFLLSKSKGGVGVPRRSPLGADRQRSWIQRGKP